MTFTTQHPLSQGWGNNTVNDPQNEMFVISKAVLGAKKYIHPNLRCQGIFLSDGAKVNYSSTATF